jgi:hypothetical protein
VSPRAPSQIDHYLWVWVCEQLKFHNKGSDRCIDTLNRLWRKHPRVKGAEDKPPLEVPTLTEEMLLVSLEQWSLQRLQGLQIPHQRDDLRSPEPIIILHWRNQDFVIDGNTRVNYWVKERNEGPHAVLKIEEARR